MNAMFRFGALAAIALLIPSAASHAACSAAPDSLNFGSVQIDEDTVMTLVLTNDGSASVVGTLNIESIAYNPFYFGTGQTFWGYDIEPGGTLSVDLHCEPWFTHQWETRIDLGAIGADCDLSYVPVYAYSQPPPNPGEPACRVSPSIQILFPPTVVGGESIEELTVRNDGTDLNNGAGYLVGDMPKIVGEFVIPWGGPYAVTYYQKWDVHWRPTTPGWQSTPFDFPDMCEEYGVLLLRGLALIDGVACDLSTTDLNLGQVGVGETAYGAVTIQNVGDELLPLVIPAACGPFEIVNTPYHRTLAPAEELQLNIEFTPTEPGYQTCDLDLGDAACEPVTLTGVGVVDDGVTDRVGIWFEQSGTLDRHDTVTPFETVAAYLMILNPSVEWGAQGWELCVEMVGDGVGMSWDLNGPAVNIDTPPCFSVGLETGSLYGENVIVLATLTFIQPDPDTPTYFYVHPVGDPSLPGVPVYVNGADETDLIPMVPSSGFETVPVAVVNEVTTDVPTIPSSTELKQARPNPFNPSTTLAFSLADERRASLAIHDMRGRLVRTLADEVLSAGDHERVWDGRDGSGRTVESGVYFARLIAGDQRRMLKVVLLK